jgi:hypothetical protein
MYRKIFLTIWSKISALSMGKTPFEEWMRVTSHGDLASFYYALYAATWPGSNTFDVNCQHCSHANSVTLDIKDVQRVEDEEAYAATRKTLFDPAAKGLALFKNSIVNSPRKFRLPVSGIVAVVKMPSIIEYLNATQQYNDFVKGAKESAREGMETLYTIAMYTMQLLIPARGEAGRFYPLEDPARKMQTIGRLPQSDGRALADAIDEHYRKVMIRHQLPEFNCASCIKRNVRTDIDFEQLLFTKLRAV